MDNRRRFLKKLFVAPFAARLATQKAQKVHEKAHEKVHDLAWNVREYPSRKELDRLFPSESPFLQLRQQKAMELRESMAKAFYLGAS
jgi:hypothetical protein